MPRSHPSPYDPRINPPRPRPRTQLEEIAVAQFNATPCTNRTTSKNHLIPATTTICLTCGTDARTITRQEPTA